MSLIGRIEERGQGRDARARRRAPRRAAPDPLEPHVRREGAAAAALRRRGAAGAAARAQEAAARRPRRSAPAAARSRPSRRRPSSRCSRSSCRSRSPRRSSSGSSTTRSPRTGDEHARHGPRDGRRDAADRRPRRRLGGQPARPREARLIQPIDLGVCARVRVRRGSGADGDRPARRDARRHAGALVRVRAAVHDRLAGDPRVGRVPRPRAGPVGVVARPRGGRRRLCRVREPRDRQVAQHARLRRRDRAQLAGRVADADARRPRSRGCAAAAYRACAASWAARRTRCGTARSHASSRTTCSSSKAPITALRAPTRRA